MKKLLQSHRPKRHAKSFKFAFEGLVHTLLNEPNFRVQLVIVVAVVYFGFKYGISYIERGLLTISLGLLLAAEMINTVVENFVDELIRIKSERAKIIKDVSAGFVLITAMIVFILILLIFWDHVFQLLI